MSTTRRPRRPLPRAVVAALTAGTVGAVALAVGLAALATSAAAAGGRTVMDDGHVDIGPRIVDGRMQVMARDDTVSPPRWRGLGEIALGVGDNAAITVPDNATYAFLGSAGSKVWVLPQVQRSGIIWPGWNTQDPSIVDGVRGKVTWTITSVSGPGRFWLFLNDSFGTPSLVFDGARSWPQSTTVDHNVHAHGNWAFGAPGVYRLGFRMSGTGTAGASLSGDATLVVAVGDAARAQIPPAGEDTRGEPTAGGGSGGGALTGDDALAAEGGTLPNTGAGPLAPIAAAAATLLLVGLALRVRLRRGRGTP